MSATTKVARQAKVAASKADSQPAKAPKAKAVKVPVVQPATEPQEPAVSRTQVIHKMWELLQAGPITLDQLVAKITQSLTSEGVQTEAATKVTTSAINHQLPIELGKGRKAPRVQELKGGKLQWIGGAIRRRQAS